MKRILFLLVAWMAAWSVQAQTTQPDANGYLVKVGDQAPRLYRHPDRRQPGTPQ